MSFEVMRSIIPRKWFLLVIIPYCAFLTIINILTSKPRLFEHVGYREWNRDVKYLLFGNGGQTASDWKDLNKAQLLELIQDTPTFDHEFVAVCHPKSKLRKFLFNIPYVVFKWRGWVSYITDWESICMMRTQPLHDTHYLVRFGDQPGIHNTRPILEKSRRLNYNGTQYVPPVVVRLNYGRHWKQVRMTIFTYIPWSQKKNEIAWRGATTGKTLLRYDYVKTLADLGHNVRFHKLANLKSGFVTTVDCRPYLGNKMKRRELMKYKYILSLEGNDVASNLKWLMSHNSVIIMPTPTFETYLMEGLLQPWIHYVPFNDPNKINELLDWLIKNDDKCKKIVQNANAWIYKFHDNTRTRYIHSQILKETSEWMKRQLEINNVRIKFKNSVLSHVDNDVASYFEDQ